MGNCTNRVHNINVEIDVEKLYQMYNASTLEKRRFINSIKLIQVNFSMLEGKIKKHKKLFKVRNLTFGDYFEIHDVYSGCYATIREKDLDYLYAEHFD